MPSWVVPAVAAEMWGVSVEHILAEVANGRVRSRKLGQLLFVDIDPAVEAEKPAETVPATYRRSLTWASSIAQPVITAAERDALLDDGNARPVKPSVDESELEAGLQNNDDEQLDWRRVRARVSTTRRPPASRGAA